MMAKTILLLSCCGALLLSSQNDLRAGDVSSADLPAFYAGDPQLEQYVHTALRRNPQLQARLARYRAALQKVPQVTALPDPELSFTQFVRNVETRVGPQLNVVALSQKFPWFGKLDLKGKVAFKQAAARYRSFRVQEREVIAQVKRAFYDLAYLDWAVRITREKESLLAHYEELALARYSSGQGLQQAVIRIQAETTQIVHHLEMLQQQRTTLAAKLNTLMDRPPEEAIPSVEKLHLPRTTFNLDELYRLGERNRDELKAAMALIEKSEQAIELAKKVYWPDVTLSAGMINVGGRAESGALLPLPPDSGKNAFNFSIGINIPIQRDKYQAGVLEATESLIAQRKEYHNIRNEMEFSIRDQVFRLETLHHHVDLFERVLIPQAEEALRSTESAYQTGQLEALDLLDGERVLFEVKLVNARHHADYLSALATLERAVGTKFPE